MGWNVKDAAGSNVNNNGVTASSRFDVASQLSNVTFASIQLGSIYDWGKPTTPTDELRTFNVTSQTTSIQNFQSSYQSDAGKSSTGFDISSSMYFLTQAFPRWDGYSIYNDPEVSVMVSKGTDPTSSATIAATKSANSLHQHKVTSQPQPSLIRQIRQQTSNHQNQHSPNTCSPNSIHYTAIWKCNPESNTSTTTTEIPSMTILIIAVVGAIAAIGSLMAGSNEKTKDKLKEENLSLFFLFLYN